MLLIYRSEVCLQKKVLENKNIYFWQKDSKSNYIQEILYWEKKKAEI